MGKIVNSYIFPHPPIIIPEVGGGREGQAQKTVDAVKKAALDIKNDAPTTIVITSPHAPVFNDYIYITSAETIYGDMRRFGAKSTSLEFKINKDLVNNIINDALLTDIPCGDVEDNFAGRYALMRELDHGAFVPLYFISKEYDGFKLVHISIAGMPLMKLYKFGMSIRRAVENSNENVVFVASGDLSHSLTYDAPCGYDKAGKEFDEFFIQSIKNMDVKSLLNIDSVLHENASECGLRSFIIMLGALDGLNVSPQVYSYEGPFGVGYSIAKLEILKALR